MKTLDDLKPLKQWVGHHNKVPKNPFTGGNASTNDPSTWGTAAQAWAAKKRHGWDGIGYVFTIAAGVIGIDLDKCFEDDGNLLPWARDIVQVMQSYTEKSPSGKGLHILALGTIPESHKNGKGFEIYNELRYFTVTGNAYGGKPLPIMERQKEIDAIYYTMGGDLDDPKPLPDLRPAEPRDVTPQQVEDILNQLPVHGDYNTYWLPILMAVHDAFPNETGVQLIEKWSPGYKGEVRRKFGSFDRTSKSGIGIGTLFHIAKQHGIQLPRTEKPAPARKPARRTMADKASFLMGV